MTTLTKPSVREAAEDLVRANLEAAPEVTKVYLFPSDDEIRLIYVDPTTMPLHPGDAIAPFYFGASRNLERPSDAYTAAIAVIRPEEVEKARLPEGWGDWVRAETRIPEVKLAAGDHLQPGLDSMTGVPNRQLFLSCLKLFVEARVPLSVLLVDLDRFAQVNYHFSHAVGDDILCRIAAILQASVHGTSSIARYGGNEFAMMLACTEPHEASLIAERLRAAVAGYA